MAARLLVFGAAIVGTLAMGLYYVDVEDAAATNVPVVHWNIHGGCSGGGNCGGLDSAHFLAFMVGLSDPSVRPWAITLNEVCRPQATYLNTTLGGMGYRVHFDVTNENTSSEECEKHGNWVAYLGAIPPEPRTYSQPLTYQTPGGDTRRLACRKARQWGVDRWFCVTHLDGIPNAPYQDANVYHRLTTAPTLAPFQRILGADRNIECPKGWGEPLRCLSGDGYIPWTNFKTMDAQMRPTFTAGNPSRTIDWVFASAVGTSATSSPGPVCSLVVGLSDHCWLPGTITSF